MCLDKMPGMLGMLMPKSSNESMSYQGDPNMVRPDPKAIMDQIYAGTYKGPEALTPPNLQRNPNDPNTAGAIFPSTAAPMGPVASAFQQAAPAAPQAAPMTGTIDRNPMKPKPTGGTAPIGSQGSAVFG